MKTQFIKMWQFYKISNKSKSGLNSYESTSKTNTTTSTSSETATSEILSKISETAANVPDVQNFPKELFSISISVSLITRILYKIFFFTAPVRRKHIEILTN